MPDEMSGQWGDEHAKPLEGASSFIKPVERDDKDVSDVIQEIQDHNVESEDNLIRAIHELKDQGYRESQVRFLLKKAGFRGAEYDEAGNPIYGGTITKEQYEDRARREKIYKECSARYTAAVQEAQKERRNVNYSALWADIEDAVKAEMQ